MRDLCMAVRLTPAERVAVRRTLMSCLGADLRLSNGRTVRVRDTAESVLIDAVTLGPRGYTPWRCVEALPTGSRLH